MAWWLALRDDLQRCLQLFLPAVCLLCQERLPDGQPADQFCPSCRAGIPAPAPARCPNCAVAHRTLTPSLHLCEPCLRDPPPFTRVHAVGPYRDTLRTAIQHFKFRDGLVLERPLGQLLAEVVRTGCATQLPELLVPVPMPVGRLRHRGYNQAVQLARQVGRQLGVPVAATGLRRQRETAPQQSLDARIRQTNVRGAFAATAPLHGRRILLIDDVMTTGATARECASVLRQAGAASVEVAVLARA